MSDYNNLLEEYTAFVNQTAIHRAKENDIESLTNAILGMCAESGELANIVKKISFQDGNYIATRRDIWAEMGDVLWYLIYACQVMNVTLEELMLLNMKKLKARYPTKSA